MTRAEEELLWQLEHDYWTCSHGGRSQSTDAQSVVAFYNSANAVSGDALEVAHDRTPLWTRVQLDERAYARPAVGVAVLGYTARTQDENGGKHRFICTSVWLRRNGIWSHIQHQQSPAGA